MNYREKREIVTSLMAKSISEDEMRLCLQDAKEGAACMDKISRLIVRNAPMELAVYRGTPWVFNGRYYEDIKYEQIKYGIDEFLYQRGVSATYRTEKCLFYYMKRFEERMKEHELHPRLSLMCFTNCVVDMNTMKKYAFSPEHDVIKMYGFKYDRRAILSCKMWNAFLGENYLVCDNNNDGVLPEKSKRRLLQMFLGACLVDRKIMSFEYFLILQGTGANGKSVIQKVLSGIFGDDEMLNIKLSQFARSGDEGLRAVASMEGKRLLHCTESSKADFKDMSTIKAISSGEPLAGRSIGGNIRQFQRPPLLLCNSNYRWSAEDFVNRDDSSDISVQRRAVIINFEKSIPVEKRDAMLADKMKSEYAGIFAWIVKGLVDLKASGWRLPESKESRIDTILSQMSGECVVRGGKARGSVVEWASRMTMYPEQATGKRRTIRKRTSSELYYSYGQFCKNIGIEVVSLTMFGKSMSSLGFKKEKSGDCQYIIYIDDASIANDFDTFIPTIFNPSDEERLFHGTEMSIEDYVNEISTESDGMAEEG